MQIRCQRIEIALFGRGGHRGPGTAGARGLTPGKAIFLSSFGDGFQHTNAFKLPGRSISVVRFIVSELKPLCLVEEVIVAPARRELEVFIRADLFFFHLPTMNFATEMLLNVNFTTQMFRYYY